MHKNGKAIFGIFCLGFIAAESLAHDYHECASSGHWLLEENLFSSTADGFHRVSLSEPRNSLWHYKGKSCSNDLSNFDKIRDNISVFIANERITEEINWWERSTYSGVCEELVSKGLDLSQFDFCTR